MGDSYACTYILELISVYAEFLVLLVIGADGITAPDPVFEQSVSDLEGSTILWALVATPALGHSKRALVQARTARTFASNDLIDTFI
jgi:hypothetical protein